MIDIESKISAVDCTDICILRRVGFNLVLYEPKTMSECIRRLSFFISWYLQKKVQFGRWRKPEAVRLEDRDNVCQSSVSRGFQF